MFTGKYECYACGEVFDTAHDLWHHEREEHIRQVQ